MADYPRKPPKPIQPARQFFPEPDIQFIVDQTPAILRERITLGPWVEELERLGKEAAGTKHGIAVNNCTTALEIIVRALAIGPGDEVIVPPQTFIATAFAVLHAGAKPVFAEIDPATHALSPSGIAAKLSERTRAVIIVHLAGLISPEIDEILDLCRRNNVALIEDCAHAQGSRKGNRPAGSIGVAGAFSYYATKVLTTGEGGLITTNDDALASVMRSYQARGQDLTRSDEEIFILPGRSCRMTAFSGLCGVVQHRRLEEFVARRNQVAAAYEGAIQEIPLVQTIAVPPDTRHSYWKHLLRLPKEMSRDALRDLLARDYGVPLTWSYWPPAHLQPVMQELLGYRPGDLPISEAAMQQNVSLPMHAALDDETVAYVAQAFVEAVKRLAATR